MNLEEISKRAKEVADKLGIDFIIPDYNASKEKAERNINMRQEYLSRKEEYDNAIEAIFNTYSPDVIKCFIEQNKKS